MDSFFFLDNVLPKVFDPKIQELRISNPSIIQ